LYITIKYLSSRREKESEEVKRLRGEGVRKSGMRNEEFGISGAGQLIGGLAQPARGGTRVRARVRARMLAAD
jgi:hypothetical protein